MARYMFRQRLAVVGPLLLLVLLATLLRPSQAFAAPSVALSSNSGPAGTGVTVQGSGWPAGDQIVVRWQDGQQIGESISPVSGTGNFAGYFYVPQNATAGTYTVSFQDTRDTNITARASFSVTIPTITLQPFSGPPGTAVTAQGSGWPGGKNIELSWDGTIFLNSAYADTNGNVSIPFAVPTDATLGDHVVLAEFTNGNFPVEKQKTFTVTSSSPPPGDCSDEFSSSSLASDWTWVDPLNDASYSLIANPGSLRIHTDKGNNDLNPGYNTNGPRLVQSLSGNFDASTKVTVALVPGGAQYAGLLVWFNNTNFIFIARDVNNSIATGFYRNGASIGPPVIPNIPNTTLYFRITRAANTFTTYYSLNGTAWTQTGTIDYAGAAPTAAVGMFVINQWQDNPVSADFEYFHCSGSSSELSISDSGVFPVQVVEGADLVVNKPMAIHVTVTKNTSSAINNARLTLRYNNGTSQLETFYLNDSVNWNQRFQLQSNTDHLDFSANGPTHADIYFIADDLRPTNVGKYPVQITLTWPGGTKAYSYEFSVRDGWNQKKDILFYPVAGYTSSYNDNTSIKEALEFTNAVFPMPAGAVYRSSGRPLVPYFGPPVASPNPVSLAALMVDLFVAGHLIDPSANRVVGVTPKDLVNRFSCVPLIPCQIVGISSQNIPYVALVEDGYGLQAFTQEVAHELGHTWGHWTHSDALDSNGTPLGVKAGFWVSRKQRMYHGDKYQGIMHNVLHFMSTVVPDYKVPNTYRQDAWITKDTYQSFLATPSSSTAVYVSNNSNSGSILISGFISTDEHIDLNPWYRLSTPPVDLPSGNGVYSIKVLDPSGGVLYSSSFDVRFTLGDPPVSFDKVPFAFSVPDFAGAASIVVLQNGSVVTRRNVSPYTPNVTITVPKGGQKLVPGDVLNWNATDPDGDELTHSILLSNDGGVSWSPLALNISGHQITLPATPPGEYYLRIVTTDGINTRIVTSGLFKIFAKVSLPIVRSK